jgi:DNA-binding NarL/FixJ family response regulator
MTVRVLAADDSTVFLGALADVVRETPGFELVGTVDSGECAIAVASSECPDLVLMDVRMPGLGGIEAARRIAEAHPGTLIVLMSADGSRTVAERTGLATVDKGALSPSLLEGLWRARRSATGT